MTENISQSPDFTILKKRNKIKTVFLIILLVIVVFEAGCLVALGYYYRQLSEQKRVVEIKLVDTNSEKDQITDELTGLLQQYEALETDNENLKVELDTEKEKIRNLMVEIKNVKAFSFVQKKKYEEELELLRDIMKGYIRQIDSLNTVANVYKDKYTVVKSDYEAKQKDYDSLAKEKDDLSEKVDIAAVLKAVNISALAINQKSKPVEKAKKVDKFKICFTVRENPIAKPGSKTVFLRISRPDSLIIINTPDNVFNYEGNMIAYTERREIEYENKDIDICIYWKKTQELIQGIYSVDIFADKKQIGKSSFELK
ncbi:MAG: hypothetical protein HY738_23490 [Bacteroidia bacterium]|nr:hypothetical protein [Bacteroidia bacterium]